MATRHDNWVKGIMIDDPRTGRRPLVPADFGAIPLGMEGFEGRAIIPHRGGGGNLAPDNELDGFRYGIAMGSGVIDIDCDLGSDNTLIVIHDDTIDRTCTTTGSISGLDLAGVRALVTKPATYLAAAGWPAGTVPTLDDICRLWGNQYVLHIQPRSLAAGNAVASCLMRHGIRTEMAVLNSDDQSWVAAARALGFSSSQNAASAANQGPNMAGYYANGARYLNCGTGWTESLVQQAHAAGLLAGIYGQNRISERDAFWAMGGDFILSDEPVYQAGRGTQRLGNQFAGGFWPHGVLPFATSSGGRGRVTVAGQWQQTQLDVNPRACVLGFLGVTSGSFTLDFKLRMDTSRAANASYHLFICTSTDAAINGVSGSYGTSGYFIVLRRTQQYSVYRVDGASTITLLGETSAGSALAGTGSGADADGDKTPSAGSGTAYAFRIGFNPTTGAITVANVTSPHASGTLTATDATKAYSGGYIHAGRNNITSTIDAGFQLT